MDPRFCDIVIVQNCNGHFVGTKPLDGKLFNIGEVPKFIVNKHRSPEGGKTSTPKETHSMSKLMVEPNVSPIVENQNTSQESGFSFNATSDSTLKLREEIKKLEELPDIDKPKKEEVKVLNIKDIGNDT